MYLRILVPVIFDPDHRPDAALEVAKAIAAEDARVTFLHVIEELPVYAARYVSGDFIEKSRDDVRTRLNEITVLFHLLKIEYSALFCNFLKLLVVSTILNFAFTLNSLVPYKILLYINVIAVFLQVISLFMFVKLVKTKLMLLLKNQSKLVIYLYAFSLFCFVLKTLLQTLSILPEVSRMVYNQHNFIIGFIHLMMLGIISGFLFIFIINEKLIQHTKSLYFGVYSFVIGFVLTEIILIIQACKFYFASGFIPNYYLILFVFSILLPLGVFFILFNIIKTNYHEITTSKTT